MHTVLLAEDNLVVRTSHTYYLTRGGFVVVQATNGEEALELARTSAPDLIILDLLMPKLGGVEVLTTLKQDPRLAHVPVIIISSLSERNERKLLDLGAVAYREKEQLLPRQLPGLVQDVLQATAHPRAK